MTHASCLHLAEVAERLLGLLLVSRVRWAWPRLSAAPRLSLNTHVSGCHRRVASNLVGSCRN